MATSMIQAQHFIKKIVTYRLPYDSNSRLRGYNLEVPSGCSFSKCIFSGYNYNGITYANLKTPVYYTADSLFVDGQNFSSGDYVDVTAFFVE